MSLKFHPLAELFPLMVGAEFDALTADIKAHGLREPVVLHDGMILDGRNRYRACERAKVKPTTEEWEKNGSAQEYVVSKNLHRRHLNESQRAMIAAKMATLKPGDVQSQASGVGIPTSTTRAAELLNIHRSTVQDAKTIRREGTAKEIEAVEQGKSSVHTIAMQIRERVPAKKRAKGRGGSRNQVGKNPERIERLRIRAEVWGNVRNALICLTSLPRAADVVVIVQQMDQAGLVKDRLKKSIKWLEEFDHAWSKRGKAS